MYKILIKYSSATSLLTLWQVYGSTTTTSTSDSDTSTVTFTEYETDDITELQEEISKLDKRYGYENIKVIKDVDVTYSATISDTDTTDATDDNSGANDTSDTTNNTDAETTENTTE